MGLCESRDIGPGCRVWAFAHVLEGARLGSDCNICGHVLIEGGVVLGDRVTVKSNTSLWDGVTAEDDVFIGPGVSFANDRYPRSKRPVDHPGTILRRGASLGAGAVILPGVEIGAFALVAAGAVVAKSVPPFTLVKGNPARPAGLVCRCGAPLIPSGDGWRCRAGDWRGQAPSPEMSCSAI